MFHEENDGYNEDAMQNGTTKHELVIRVDGLTAWIPAEKPWYRRKPTRPKLPILNNVSGTVKGGEFVAIIGPSGAGKTTFLVSLAGKSTLPSTGSVTVNGVAVTELPNGFLEIVPQFEVFMESLSVSEHLKFMVINGTHDTGELRQNPQVRSTEMKLGSCARPENRLTLDNLMSSLTLRKHANTTIKSLSGGERRLLSLATSLLSSPKIVICDEPTTGLDSSNALLVVSSLKKLADSGILVICSIHQPSSIVFKEFNSIMLMAEGKLVFHGSQEQCRDLFESINLKLPKNYNPAEFYIKAISNDPNTKLNYTDKIQRSFQNLLALGEETCTISTVQPKATFLVSRRHWLKQVSLLLWRSSLSFRRQVVKEIIKLIVSMLISGMIIGTCYAGISGTTQRGIQDIQGFLWLLTSEVCYGMAYNALFAFDEEMALFRREKGLYSGSAFFMARFCCYIPRCVIYPVAFLNIASLTVALPNHAVTILEFMAALMWTAVASVAYGLGMGAWLASSGITGEAMSFIDLPLYLVSGAFLRLSSVPMWLYYFKYVSHFYYGLDAMSNIYWRQIEFIECPSNSTRACVRDGASFLAESGYSSNYIVEDCLGILLVAVIWCLVGYWGIKREERKGYAY